MMKRMLTIAAASLALAGCKTMYMPSLHHNNKNPYEGRIFYTKYLNPQGSPLDAQIQRDVDSLRANPNSASVHNDLGAALLQKGFPKDAEVEFERAVNADRRFYPAWYNLGLVRAAHGDMPGSALAFRRTVHYKPGHAPALFQLGLVAERSGRRDDAVDYYIKALTINHQLLDVRVNPRILDSKLIDITLIKMYPLEHSRASMNFQGTPPGYVDGSIAPSPQAPAPPIKVAPTPVVPKKP
jgi:tetratricopeptide (TPR) repeat protein